MNIGKACAVFEQINSEKYEEQEKLNAIKQVIEMPTHNSISKAEIINAFRWFFNWAAEESNKNQTNADRIRNMTDEELADFLMDISMGMLFDKKIMNVKSWLQSEVEE